MTVDAINRKVPWAALSAFAGLMALLAAIWLGPRLLAPPTAASLATPADCDLSAGPCRAAAGESALTLMLNPRQPRALEPLQFQVRTEALDADSISIVLEGRDMYMGYNRIELQPSPADPVLWTGTGELAICTTGEMIWLARVEAGTAGGPATARFEFSAR
ncbi:hypothetical protein [Marinobacterium aestuariivivens]|uniref:YtkA-like domain-containing protein n=1 Tax=Marinobacterium aestuariivivens TaxID=1698799 RepID=A0ABW2A5F1_9GAMM